MTAVRTRRVRALERIAALTTTAVLLIGGLSAVGNAATAAETTEQAVTLAAASGSIAEGSIVKTADLSKFQAGNIISDAAFFNAGTMSEAQIQSFLQSKVPNCQSGYICLKDWYDTSRTTTADAMCGAYSGGIRERASTILYKVAQACGINPQVLIVMLQKEQGLVTHTWPSDWRYTIAMGQGCPDTAACDTRYYGFFNQVYGAAWQLKRYANPPGTSAYFTWFAPGKTWNVRWHPNEACGSSPVYIQNQATANLYYYTPYQPNAAAIRAGYGEGDGCSAYGNRNFYQYFTDWFGATQRDPAAEIEAEYQAQGATATLGAAQSGVLTISQNGGGYARAYAAGSIYWTSSTGAKTVLAGALRDYYFARNGAAGDIGWPVLNQQSVATATGNGTAQLFTGGSLYASGRGTFVVREPVRTGYFAHSGAAGRLAWPTSDQTCAAGICTQSFEGGSVVSSPSGSFGLFDPVRSAFEVAGGATGSWGVPTSTLMSMSYGGGGFGQAFANGSAYHGTGGPAYFVTGAIRDRYFAIGGAASRLGYPIADQQCTVASACQQEFQGGAVVVSPAGSFVLTDPVRAAYGQAGGLSGSWGAPTTEVMSVAANGGGYGQAFANGSTYYRTGGAAFYVSGHIRDFYFQGGGAGGRLGFPAGVQECTDATSCQQEFQFGWILWSSSTGARIGAPAIDDAYVALGGASGALGARSGTLIAYSFNGGGFAETFANGAIFYQPAVGSAHGVWGSVRDAYFAAGGAAGRYGWPTSPLTCAASVCTQQFQGGSISAPG